MAGWKLAAEKADTEHPFSLDVVSVRLIKQPPIYTGKPLKNPQEVVAAMGDIMCAFDREVVCIVNMKTDMTPINVNFASVGAVDAAMAHPREMLKSSILSNAARIILIHNHPSGNLIPSREDTAMTDRLNRLCALVNIPLADSIIVGGDNRDFFSFKEKGLISNPRFEFASKYWDLDLDAPMVAEKEKAR